MMLNKNDIEHQFQNQLLILSIIKISTFKEKKSPQETPANFPTSPEVYDLNNFIKKWISQDWRISDSQKNGRNRLVKTILTKYN